MSRKLVVKLNDLLRKYDLSLNELSLRSGVRRAALSELANGKRERIQFEHIERIADALNIDDIREIIDLEYVPDDDDTAADC